MISVAFCEFDIGCVLDVDRDSNVKFNPLEPVSFKLNRNHALIYCFIAFCFDEPASTSSQNALDHDLTPRRTDPRIAAYWDLDFVNHGKDLMKMAPKTAPSLERRRPSSNDHQAQRSCQTSKRAWLGTLRDAEAGGEGATAPNQGTVISVSLSESGAV